MAKFAEVTREYRRLCDAFKTCKECPLDDLVRTAPNCETGVCRKYPEEAELIIMQWAAEHPIVTNRMRFEEVFGCSIVTHEIHEAIPGHVKILNASDEEFETWLNSEYKGGTG